MERLHTRKKLEDQKKLCFDIITTSGFFFYVSKVPNRTAIVLFSHVSIQAVVIIGQLFTGTHILYYLLN